MRAVAAAFGFAVFVWFAIVLNAIGIGLFAWLSLLPAWFAYRQAHKRLRRGPRAPDNPSGDQG